LIIAIATVQKSPHKVLDTRRCSEVPRGYFQRVCSCVVVNEPR
jgi:hypothetical protein